MLPDATAISIAFGNSSSQSGVVRLYADRRIDFILNILVVARLGGILDELNNPFHFLVGHKRALNPRRLRGAPWA